MKMSMLVSALMVAGVVAAGTVARPGPINISGRIFLCQPS